MSATPAFAVTPKSYATNIATMNTALGTPVAFGTLVTGTSSAISIPAVFIKALATTTAGSIQFFKYDGTGSYLFHEEPVSAVAPVPGTPSFETVYVPDLPINIPVGWTLRVATRNAESFNIVAMSAAEY